MSASKADALKEAVRLLWGQGVENNDFPAVDTYSDGEMPGSMRVAFAANRGETLDGHFRFLRTLPGLSGQPFD